MNELLARLCEAMGNADMQEGLIAAMQALLNDPSLVTGEEEAVRPLHETTDPPPSRHNKEDEVLNKMHEDTPHQGIRQSAPLPALSQEKERNDSPITSDSNAAPRRGRRVQSSPTHVKKRPHIEVPRFAKVKKSKREARIKKRKKAPSSPSSSPSSWGESSYSSSSSSEEEEHYSSPKRTHDKERKKHDTKRRPCRSCKFKEGGKSITFLTYDGKFGDLDKVLAFIQPFDTAFRDENFSKSSKL